MSHLSTQTESYQKKLAKYVLSGEKVKIPGVREDRLHHYYRLINNVIKNNLKEAYPVAYKVIDRKIWIKITNDFIQNHKNKTPFIWKLPYEFYGFVIKNDFSNKLNLPFLNDLLYFEWIEIEMYTMMDKKIPGYSKVGEIYEDKLVFNPEYKIVKLEYPVHMMSVEKAVQQKGEYYYVVFRNIKTRKVHFMNLSSLHVYIIDQLDSYNNELFYIIKQTESLLLDINRKELIDHVKTFVEDLIYQGLILGYKNKKDHYA